MAENNLVLETVLFPAYNWQEAHLVKWMIGRLYFPYGFQHIFRCCVSFREGISIREAAGFLNHQQSWKKNAVVPQSNAGRIPNQFLVMKHQEG